MSEQPTEAEVEGLSMRFIPIVLALLTACGSKKNPNLCCTDEMDCTGVGLDEIQGCADGLVCRGNQCIAEVCNASNECEAAAPFCVGPPDGRCQEQCTDDSQCPGFGGATTELFCIDAACVECRDSSDCSGNTPVCESGACVGCVRNDECESQACSNDGSCVDVAMIAYVAPTGSPTGTCTKTSPCSTIEFALTQGRPVVVIDSGTYIRNAALNISSATRLIGSGLSRPVVKRSSQGAIINVAGTTVGLENLQIEGATGPIGRDVSSGSGVVCNFQGASQVNIVDCLVRGNVNGVGAQNCTLTSERTTFQENTNLGIEATDSIVTIDRSTFTLNGGGANGDAGTYSITNSFFTRNTGFGLKVFFFSAGNRVEFNTIVDNGGDGFNCQVQGATGSFVNNIIARNMRQTNGTANGCTYPSSIIIDTDITPIKFVSPDAAPFDYHIQTGSLAIDAASITTIDHDFDGAPRTSDAADVGADEL